jgi:hypothetical protein
MGRVYQEVDPTTAHRLKGGRTPFANPGLQEIIFMDSRSSCGEDRVDRSRAFERAVCWGIPVWVLARVRSWILRPVWASDR